MERFVDLRRIWSGLAVVPALAVAFLFAGASAKPPEVASPSKSLEEEYVPPIEMAAEVNHGHETVSAPNCCRGGRYPVCRRVAIVKKKPHTEYDAKCELVCVPGCSLFHGCKDGCSCNNVVIREKKTLLKKVTEKESCSYEYKIFWVCRSCAFGSGCSSEVSR